MTFYVEGSPSGPESFRTEAAAREWAQGAADRFGVRTTLHSSATGHAGIRRGVHLQSEGQTLAAFTPGDDTTHVCADGRTIIDTEAPVAGNAHRDAWCAACGERLLLAGYAGGPA